MVFSSLTFLYLFFPITLTVYAICPRRYRNAWLLVASLFFYGWGEPKFLLLMVFSILVNYVHGLLLGRSPARSKKSRYLVASDVVINLALLGYFKYAGLISDAIRLIPAFGGMPEVKVPLPIGISFYTFQTMSYVIDVYRGDAPVQKNLVSFAAYVTLFPQLIAGPIVRYVDIDRQLNEERRIDVDQVARGMRQFLCGLAKKVLLANRCGALWTALQGTQMGLVGSWAGIIAYTLQIYFDFSGYSDMALGLGRMFGFDFKINFNYPYISRSNTEFWRRWHISLGTWFREYVYIPLGGNRKGKARMLVNTCAVWLLTGLWHGASVNFILWGAYFAVLLIVEKTFLLKWLERTPKAVQHLYAILCFVLGWVIFYFDDMGQMGAFFRALFTLKDGWLGHDAGVLCLRYLPVLLAGAAASLPLGHRAYEWVTRQRWGYAAVTAGCVALLALLTALLISQSYNPFLYFRF